MIGHNNISYVSRGTCATENWANFAKKWLRNADNVREGLRNRSDEHQAYSF